MKHVTYCKDIAQKKTRTKGSSTINNKLSKVVSLGISSGISRIVNSSVDSQMHVRDIQYV